MEGVSEFVLVILVVVVVVVRSVVLYSVCTER